MTRLAAFAMVVMFLNVVTLLVVFGPASVLGQSVCTTGSIGESAPRGGQCYAVSSGDPNGDGLLNVADPVYLLSYLFTPGNPAPVALAQAIPQVPVGSVMAFAGAATTVPTGWLLCDGTLLAVSTHPDLYAVLENAHGGSPGISFNLPDLRGRFVRGADAGSQHDPDAISREAAALGGAVTDVGSLQDWATASPHSPFAASGDVDFQYWNDACFQSFGCPGQEILDCGSTPGAFNCSKSFSTTVSGGDSESRPVNIALNYIIKY